jgi:hypothetical protein
VSDHRPRRKGPLTGIEQPEYTSDDPWQVQQVQRITGALRSEGAARRGGIVLFALILLPFVLIVLAVAIAAIF